MRRLSSPLMKYAIIGHFIFLASFVLSLIFSDIRSVNGVSSEILVNLINHTSPWPDRQHLYLLFPQLLSYMAVTMGLSLPYIFMVYSSSFVLQYYLIFLLLTYGFKNISIGLCWALLMVNQSFQFIHISSPMLLSLAFVLIWYAWNKNHVVRDSLKYFAVALLLIVLPIMLSPYAFLPILFVLSYQHLKDGQRSFDKNYLILFLFICFCFFVRLFITHSQTVYFNKEFVLSGIYFTNGIKFLIHQATTTYFFVYFLIFYLFLFLFAQKKYNILFLFLCFLILWSIQGFLISGYANTMEASSMPLVLFALFVFTEEIVVSFYRKKNIIISLMLAIIYGALLIYMAITFYQKRNHYLDKLYTSLKKYPEKTFSLERSKISVWKLDNTQYLDTESFLYTTEKYNDTRRFVCFDAPSAVATMLPKWKKNINTHYFKGFNNQHKIVNTNPIPLKRFIGIYSGAESFLYINGEWFFVKNKKDQYQLRDIEALSEEKVYEGKYALKLDVKHRFGYTIKIPDLEQNDSVCIRAKRWGNEDGIIVITHHEFSKKWYYTDYDIVGIDENGWESLELKTKIPFGIDHVKIYVWNKNVAKGPCYVDNFSIEIFRE